MSGIKILMMASRTIWCEKGFTHQLPPTLASRRVSTTRVLHQTDL